MSKFWSLGHLDFPQKAPARLWRGSAPGGDLSLGFSHLDFRCEAPGGLSVKGGVMMMTTRRLA